MPTRTVRLFEADVEFVERESRLHDEAPFASHANEVLGRVEGDNLREAVRDALEDRAGET